MISVKRDKLNGLSLFFLPIKGMKFTFAVGFPLLCLFNPLKIA
jgi:hypothetical protein